MHKEFFKTELIFEDGFEASVFPNETADFLFEKGNMDPYEGYKIISFDALFHGRIEALDEYFVEEDSYGFVEYKGVPTDILLDTLCEIHGDVIERRFDLFE